MKNLKQKIFDCANSHGKIKSPKITTLTKYLKETFKDKIIISFEKTNCVKDTMISGTRLRSPGRCRYYGYVLSVAIIDDKYILEKYNRYSLFHNGKYYETLFEHNTTETYHRNYEICEKIIKLHELLY